MTYSSFAADVLVHGAHFACNHAARIGITGSQQAKWLSRLAIKTGNRVVAV